MCVCVCVCVCMCVCVYNVHIMLLIKILYNRKYVNHVKLMPQFYSLFY